MQKKITMADIAKLSGVGKSTISRYFNGGYVKQETRERIQRVIGEYDYEPNAFARLNAKASNVIGVVVPTLNSKIAGRVTTSIDRYLRSRDYTTLIKNSDHDVELEILNMKRLMGMKVDGILLSAISITQEHRELIQQAEIPIVVLAQEYEDGISVVDDDYRAGLLMGEYVGKQGFERVAYIGAMEWDRAVGVERKQGVLEGLSRCQIADPVVIHTGFSFEEGYAAAKQLYESGMPEAVICATDRLAYGLYQFLGEKGLQVPEDVSVAGFGGYQESSLLRPPLTTLKFDSYGLGYLGAETLLKMIKGEPVPKKQVVDFSFLLGESVRGKRT
ncbi:MAG: LacI family DNA-binding transcriptional regulator [bacterium]|nr:LacI family DNA-binding transcriptional regulator [bacterium]